LEIDGMDYYYDNPPKEVRELWSAKKHYEWTEKSFGGKSFLTAIRKKS